MPRIVNLHTQANENKHMKTFTITRQVYNALLLVAPKNDVRYYLQSFAVQAQDNDVRVSATDGHRVLTANHVEIDASIDREYLIDTNTLKPAPKKVSNVRITLGEDTATLEHLTSTNATTLSVNAPYVDAKYPDIDSATKSARKSTSSPTGETTGPNMLAFNPAYLADVSKALECAGVGIVTPENSNMVFCVAFQGAHLSNLDYHVMPCRW
jgi:DNA polymerase III sliding clamp (beta) subunit (PCNA family)